MPSLKQVVVIGGTGGLGRVVVKAIQARSDIFDLTVLTRSSSQASAPRDVKLELLESYTDDADGPLVVLLRGKDVLVSMLGGPVAPSVDPILLSAAIKARVKRFMPSEYTLDVTYPSARQLGAGNVIGMRAAYADKVAEIAATGQIEYTTLVVGGFLDIGLTNGMLGFDVPKRTATLYDGGYNTTTGSTTAFVASAVTAVLQMPEEETRNRRIYAVETEYSGEALLTAFEKDTGEKWKVKHLTTDEMQRRGDQALIDGNLRGVYLSYVLKLNYDGSGAANLTSGLEFGRKYGLQRKSLDEVVKDAVLGSTQKFPE